MELELSCVTLVVEGSRYSKNREPPDNIIVLDNGSIIEEGNHDTLMQKKGKYFEMWEKQKPI